MRGMETLVRIKALLTAAVGAGVVIGAAGLFLYYSLEERRKLKLLQQDLARLELSLSELQQELQALRKSSHLHGSGLSLNSSSKSGRRNTFSSSRSGYDSEDDMFSALTTVDDDEFYDFNSEEEEDGLMRTPEEEARQRGIEEKLFEEVDLLMKGDDTDRLTAFNLLKKSEFEMCEKAEFLWRYAKAHQMQASARDAHKDLEGKKKFVLEGLEYASKALELDEANPDVHKWFAILTGMQADFVSIKEKIQNGYLFQKHVLIAIAAKPEDYSLHHLLGRFKFEVANVSWLEKKIASSIFAEVPDVTYADAIVDLLLAEELNLTPWKENRVLLAKCYIGDGQYEKALEWLDSAREITPRTKEDLACDEEAGLLLEKYKKYRK